MKLNRVSYHLSFLLLLLMLRFINPLSQPFKPIPYIPPKFTFTHLPSPPPIRLSLANLPTPIHTFSLYNATFHFKRDDMTGGVELGGNKLRKLEFLLAEALHLNHDCVVTIGGEQSNHCRATAAACRMLGLEPHLILRTKKANQEEIGFVGNVLIDRMVGATIYKCTPGEYGRVGSKALLDMVCDELRRDEKNPYAIPVGGSNALGSWGYIGAVEEVLHQVKDEKIDHIVFATGSAGTSIGIVLGMIMGYWPQRPPKIHAVGVCDDPDYFYQTMANIAENMGFIIPSGEEEIDSMERFIRKCVTVYQGKGLGYASSTNEELRFITELSQKTGIILDPVYTGKAMYHFVNVVMKENDFQKSKILFWHTGGTLGMYDKSQDLLENAGLNEVSIVKRLDVYGTLKKSQM